MMTSIGTVLWWLAMAALVIWMVRRAGRGRMDHGRHHTGPSHPIDPVCRMEVEPTDVEATRSANDETYVFCSQTCVEAFDKNPTMYANRSGEHRKHHHHAGC